MLNLKMGSSHEVDGQPWIVTELGRCGFALYGPYILLAPGSYVVEFRLELAELAIAVAGDPQCAVLDVSRNGGDEQLAKKSIRLSQFEDGRTIYVLSFELSAPTKVEFRVWASGQVPLRIADTPRLIPILAGADGDKAAAETRFPGAEAHDIPFFQEQRATFQRLFEEGIWIRVQDHRLVLTVAHVAMFCDCLDDLHFIGEVFHEGAYNFKVDGRVCAIDIGMNVGLTSLLFAGKAEVCRVHAFEPFQNTFDRAMANVQLNPRLAPKIKAHNVGLSDRDRDETLLLVPAIDSGSASVIERPNGEPVHVMLRDAGAALAPLIAEARAAGERVIVKVDCEGSEFAVFASLERHGLLGEISAFMVEWHAMFETRTQETLIAPLLAAGFLVFDRSPPNSNGFFYAVRAV